MFGFFRIQTIDASDAKPSLLISDITEHHGQFDKSLLDENSNNVVTYNYTVIACTLNCSAQQLTGVTGVTLVEIYWKSQVNRSSMTSHSCLVFLKVYSISRDSC